MNVLYNSTHYYVVEYPAHNGFELVDKQSGMGTFIQGDLASVFRDSMKSVIAESPTIDDMDDFLGNFDALMMQPVVYH